MTYKIQFLGVGNAFTLPLTGNMDDCDWQSNLLIIAESGKKLLLDCGSDIRFSLMQAGYGVTDIDAVFISHAHADHVGGMEWQAFSTFFNPTVSTPTLFCQAGLAGPLWNQSLRGGLESIEGRRVDLTAYYNLRKIPNNGHFVWEGIRFDLVQVVHIMAERTIKHSFGLMIYEDGVGGAPKVFWTSDTQFCPNQIMAFYSQANLILHDCETSPFKSGVHAHYSDLVGLHENVKAKMVLYHYHPGAREKFNAVIDGFLGFARKQQIITVKPDGFDLGLE